MFSKTITTGQIQEDVVATKLCNKRYLEVLWFTYIASSLADSCFSYRTNPSCTNIARCFHC